MKKVSLPIIILMLAVLLTACGGSETDSDFKLNSPNITTKSDDFGNSYSYEDGYYFLNSEITFNDALERFCESDLKENGGGVDDYFIIWDNSWDTLKEDPVDYTLGANDKKVTCYLSLKLDNNGESKSTGILFYFIHKADGNKLYPVYMIIEEDGEFNETSSTDIINSFINDIYDF